MALLSTLKGVVAEEFERGFVGCGGCRWGCAGSGFGEGTWVTTSHERMTRAIHVPYSELSFIRLGGVGLRA